MKTLKIFKIIIIYLLILMLGGIAFVNFTRLSAQEALIITALIESLTIIADLIIANLILRR